MSSSNRFSQKLREEREHKRPSTYTRRGMLTASLTALAGACCCSENKTNTDARVTSPPLKSVRPNIIVYLSDSLRADALGSYSSQAHFSPFLDKLAEESIVFERCFSQATWTKPAMASLFTGVLPEVHQTVLMGKQDSPSRRDQVLRDIFTTLAEALQAVGYRTAFFQTNAQATEELGFRKGFGYYSYVLGQSAEEQVHDVLSWLDRSNTSPFFVFIHQLDPHGPYAPNPETYHALFKRTPEEVRDSLSENDRRLLRLKENIYTERTGRPDLTGLTPEGLHHLQCLYHSEVRQVDLAVEQLWKGLERRRLSDSCCFVFTSDHGESFGEFGEFFHGNFLYWPELHIPAIIKPPNSSEGQRVSTVVGLYDLYPTLLNIGRAETPQYVFAKSLLDLDGYVKDDLPGYTWTHHMFQRLPPEQLLKIPCWGDAERANPVVDISDVTTWFVGITDGIAHLVWNPHYRRHCVAPMMARDNFTALEESPVSMRQRIDALKEQLHATLPLMARERLDFGPPAYIEPNLNAEQIIEDMRAIGYL